MGAGVEIKTDFSKIESRLNDVARKQVPFATAKTLTELAFQARAEVQKNMDKRFTLRNAWTKRGILVGKAQKKDWPFASSYVATRDEYMVDQELGAIRKSKKGRHLALPITARPSPKKLIPKRLRPKKALANKTGKRKYFVNTIKNGPNKGQEAIMRRVGVKKYPLQVLYLLGEQSRIKPRFGFRADINRVVTKNYTKEFGKQLAKSIKTSK